MRRRSNRSSANKSTPEAKTETRKSTRSSRRRKSPSIECEENTSTTITNVEDNIEDDAPKKSEELTSNILHDNEQEESTGAAPADKHVNEDEKGAHTPPHIDSAGNEATKIDEVDADEGKSKGISNSQVEENSEIQMNSVTMGSPDEENKNEVNPDVVNISIEGKRELCENQSDSDKESLSVCDVKKNSYDVQSQENEKEMSEKSELKTSEVAESEEKSREKSTRDPEDSENVKSDSVEKETETEQYKNNSEADDDQAEEGEIRDTKSDEENDKYLADQQTSRAKKTPMKIKLRRHSFLDSFNSEDNPPPKKMKWDTEIYKCLKVSFGELHRLDVEDFKALSSELKLADETEVKLEEIYQPKISRERVKSIEMRNEEVERPEYTKQLSVTSSDDQENTNIIALNRKISIVDDSASKLKPPPSPAKQPPSQILFVSNLVRPFTLKQLKELLERTGTIKEGGFWTDRIKSKCYVWYDSVEEAEATRNALHGVNWPVGNGKKLIIDFATEEQMEKARNPPAPSPPVQVAPPRANTPQKENTEPEIDQRNGDRREERKRKDSVKEKERTKPPSTREWDLGKESNAERIRSRSRDRRRKHSGKRSPTPLEDFIARKQKKLEESVPQKLMDDLFQRTKAMPCIYWQPLSPEEISVKQQQRLSRMEEHKRRLEENSRNRGVGARDRGSYRRRYD